LRPHFRALRRLAAVLLAGLTAAAWAVVGDVRVWMPAGEPTSFLEHDGTLWIGSTRGIYAYSSGKSPEFRRRYGPSEGLVGAEIALLGTNEGTLRAVSSAGAVMRFDPVSSRFAAVNTAWSEQKATLEPGVGTARGRYLVFASGDKVAFYDTRTERTELTLAGFGKGSARRVVADSSSVSILFEDGVIRSPVDWDSLGATRRGGRKVNLSDPAQWSAVDSTSLPAPDSALRRRVEALALPGDDVGDVLRLRFDAEGRLHAWAEPTVRRLDGDSWTTAFSYDPGLASTTYESAVRWLRPWALSSSGDWLFGSWGKGALVASADGSSQRWSVPGDGASCLKGYVASGYAPQPELTVVPGVVPFGKGALFAWWPPEPTSGYGLMWWDGVSDPVCRTVAGVVHQPHSLFPGPAEDEVWTVSPTEIERLRVGARLSSVSSEERYATGALGALHSVVHDGLGRLWAAGSGGLGVVCDANAPEGICLAGREDTLVRADMWLGLSDFRYTVLATDGHGRLYAGGEGSGVVRVDVSGRDLSRNGVRFWNVSSGLPSDNVRDLVVDPVDGMLYVATDRGVARISTDSRDKSSFPKAGEPIVYPNPFRPDRHDAVRFDRIPAGASVSLYSRSGRLVRRWLPSSARGGLIEWDGRDGSGRPIGPGVWNWVVSGSGKTWKGRLLVIR